MPREQHARPVNHARVHPGSARNIVAHSHRRARGPGQPRAAGAAMQVDDEIEARCRELARQSPIVGDPRQSTGVRDRDHGVQVRVPGDDRRGGRFDEVRERRVRVPAPQRADDRRREHDVADEAQADEKNPNRSVLDSGLDRGLIDQHDGDVVLNRVDPPTGVALEARAGLDDVYWCAACRADQNLEQRRIDGHAAPIVNFGEPRQK